MCDLSMSMLIRIYGALVVAGACADICVLLRACVRSALLGPRVYAPISRMLAHVVEGTLRVYGA
eukprot:4768045-Alexandrium_andersonii.AAC.1